MLAQLNWRVYDLSWLKFVFCLSLSPLLSLSVNILWWLRDSDWFTELFCLLWVEWYWLSIYGYGSGSRNLCLRGLGPHVITRGLGTAYWTYLYLTNSNDCQKIKLVLIPLDWQQSPLDECTFFLFFLSFFWWGVGVRWVCPRLNLHLDFVLKFVETRLFITY